MHARSALFDVYGDHLRARGDEAPVAALVALLDAVGIAAPAVRTAISRMAAQGWLEPVALEAGRGYRATDRAIHRLDEAAERIYRRRALPWDGCWHLAIVAMPEDRSARDRLRADLAWLGCARLAGDVWVSPHPVEDLADVAGRAGAEVVTARVAEFQPRDAPLRRWDLESLRTSYDAWLGSAEQLVAENLAAHEDPTRAAFAARFRLVHEWRKFLFTDPGLPDELLPGDWPGRLAQARFAEAAEGLRPRSDEFLARCLDAG